MSDRAIKLLLIDPDPIYRTGLRVVLEKFPDFQVVAEAESRDTAWQTLSDLAEQPTNPSHPKVNLVLSELRLDGSQSNQSSGVQLCQQLKTQYPNLPVLLLTCHPEAIQLAAVRRAGVEGYCLKGITGAELVAAIRQVASGRSHWVEESGVVETRRVASFQDLGVRSTSASATPAFLARVRDRIRLSGLQQIDTALAEVTAQLQDPGLPLLDRAVLAGQRRELLASRWLVNQLLPIPSSRRQNSGVRSQERTGEVGIRGNGAAGKAGEETTSRSLPLAERPSPLSTNTLPDTLLASTRVKLQQLSLVNLTRVPLEIDILREGKKRELLILILQKIEDTLAELRFSKVQRSQLNEMRFVILQDLWQRATTDFFGKYFTVIVGDRSIEIVDQLLLEAAVVQTEILDKVPLVIDLISYLQFATPLVVGNTPYAAGSPEANEQAEMVLQNLLIQLANGVMQPLLNNFADVEFIKQNYYERRLISTREIERFRNSLSWKYRVENYFAEPKKIFESRYELFILVSRGIAKTSVYAHRTQELVQLSGIQLVVTLALEFRDALAPRLRSVVAFLGSGIVYILTQVIGRAIGLIGRGVLQGLGGSLQESKNRK